MDNSAPIQRDTFRWTSNLSSNLLKSATLEIGDKSQLNYQYIKHEPCRHCGKWIMVRDEALGYPTLAHDAICFTCIPHISNLLPEGISTKPKSSNQWQDHRQYASAVTTLLGHFSVPEIIEYLKNNDVLDWSDVRTNIYVKLTHSASAKRNPLRVFLSLVQHIPQEYLENTKQRMKNALKSILTIDPDRIGHSWTLLRSWVSEVVEYNAVSSDEWRKKVCDIFYKETVSTKSLATVS